MPRPQAWERLATATPASDALDPPGPGQWWIPAVEGAADEIEVVPQERLHARKATFPCEGTEIVVTLEDAGTGTRITFVQHGFGPGFAEQRSWLEAGWWSIRADLYVFFEQGVACGRHLRPWSSLGCEVAEGPVASPSPPSGRAGSPTRPGSARAIALPPRGPRARRQRDPLRISRGEGPVADLPDHPPDRARLPAAAVGVPGTRATAGRR